MRPALIVLALCERVSKWYSKPVFGPTPSWCDVQSGEWSPQLWLDPPCSLNDHPN
jgi:hypothetical protein